MGRVARHQDGPDPPELTELHGDDGEPRGVAEGLRVRLRVPRHLDCDGAHRHGHHRTDRPARIRADRRTREDGDDAEGAGRPRHPRIPSSPRLRHRGGPTRPDRDRSPGRARDVRPLPGGPDARGDRGGPERERTADETRHRLDADQSVSDPTIRREKVLLCKHCVDGSPGDVLLFWEVYMRFGSTREMLQHYSSESEDEALRKLCVERDLNEREVLRRARGLQSAEALNNAVKKANAFLTYASPYGYDYVDGVLQVKNEEARVVSLIFRRYLEGKGIAKICQELNRDGYRTKTGRAWASQTIANILSNPVYCGLARLNGGIKRGKHEPLIEIDTFNKVQNEMQRRIRRPDQRKEQTPQLRLEDYT